MDLSDDKMRGEDASHVLVEKVESYIIAVKEEEAKALFRANTRIGGPMSRQPERTNDVVNHSAGDG